ncbi:MAG: hypothetical protein HWD86_01475 [Kangiellaceae bacterium]|nr:hypothetical protein [Kangiellaceae bacterium]
MNCKYHINKNALWHCQQCDTPFCIDCCDIEPGLIAPRCLLCRHHLDSYGISDKVEPFWNKLGEFNKYPFQEAALKFLMTFAVIAFVLGLIISFIPFWIIKFVLTLTIISIGIGYVFKVLTKVARGNFAAPTYDEAISFNSDEMTVKVIGLYLGLVVAGFVAISMFAEIGVIIYTLFLGFAMPAMIIILAMDKHVSSALNPVEIARTIHGIGWPYLLLTVFVYLIGLGLEFAQDTLTFWLPEALSFALTYVALAFFHIIMFAMLGYVVYQYHAELGYGIDVETLVTNQNIQDIEELRQLAHSDVYIHEGRFDDAQAVLYQVAKSVKYQAQALERLIRLNMARQDRVATIKAARAYYDNINLDQHAVQALELYKAIHQFEPRFKPMNAKARAVLISSLRSRTQQELVEHFSSDLWEKFPQDPMLAKALLAQAKYYAEIIGDDDKAIVILTKLLNQLPKNKYTAQAEHLLHVCSSMLNSNKS